MPRALGVLGALVTLAAGAPSAGAQAPTTRDSAGRRIVEARAAHLNTLPTWTVEGPTLTIGDAMGAPEYLFNRMGLVWRLRDGRIVVPNEQVEIRYFDSTGTYLKTVGRRGRGPGEYTYLLSLWRTAGDTLRAYDASANRVDVRTADGQLIRSHSIEREAGSSTSWLPDGRALYRHGARPDYSRVGRRQEQAVIRRMGADGVGLDSVLQVSSWGLMVTEPGRAIGVALAGGSMITGGAGGAIHVHGDEFAIHWFGPDGEHVAISRVAVERTRVTEADRRAFDAAAAAQRAANPNVLSEGGRRTPATAFAEFRPMISRIRLDLEGRAWVRRWTPAAARTAEWIVFERHGAPIARLQLPAEFLANDIGRDYLLGPATDADGVQYVRRYRLIRPPGAR